MPHPLYPSPHTPPSISCTPKKRKWNRYGTTQQRRWTSPCSQTPTKSMCFEGSSPLTRIFTHSPTHLYATTHPTHPQTHHHPHPHQPTPPTSPHTRTSTYRSIYYIYIYIYGVIHVYESPIPPTCTQLTHTAHSRPLCVSTRPDPPPHTCMHPHTPHHYPHHTCTSLKLHTLAHYVYPPDQTRHLPITCTLPQHISLARSNPSLPMSDWGVCRSSAGCHVHSISLARC